MKHRTSKLSSLRAALALAALFAAGSLPAQTLARFDAQFSGSKMKIDGTSTVHDWTMEGTIVAGALELDAAFLAAPDKAKPGKVAAKATASVPVRSLKSGKDSMDAVMQDAMKQTQFPKIEFRLAELALKETPKSADGPFAFDSKGELVIAGVTNKISLPVSIQRVGPGRLKTTGSIPVKMSAYGITAPAPKIALGLITTGDEVKVSFEWITAQKP
ncbi:MAG: YceI family protein [Verrucomicrobia bacterium]|nr:YceI family protein [Verrucomicrobiota bacterium]